MAGNNWVKTAAGKGQLRPVSRFPNCGLWRKVRVPVASDIKKLAPYLGPTIEGMILVVHGELK